ncbi:hypothetical protein BXZ70DRAFT_1007560 [Cristinia sonorae]|uniref:Uncharacterized protein n=1 Tax=Cristinia sonorae TaxID=1940300 RepID=A0A8K0UPE2_9AGAR|nr:hypothetical protein BXZ70DRAFT_1007560 [Cristinia sonorae]
MASTPPGTLLLSLNDTVIVILHNEGELPYAVQITVKTPRSPNVRLLTSFFLAQRDVSDLILSLASAYTQSRPPNHMIFEGEGYSVVATRRRWMYGRDKLRIMWGDEVVTPCRYKWTFTFDFEKEKEEPEKEETEKSAL